MGFRESSFGGCLATWSDDEEDAVRRGLNASVVRKHEAQSRCVVEQKARWRSQAAKLRSGRARRQHSQVISGAAGTAWLGDRPPAAPTSRYGCLAVQTTAAHSLPV